ncbi:MAG: DUF4129 domain-containing transglutaminase family protein [Verrucomicrobiales bacterium]
MNIPPFLLGAALLFWGWRVDLFMIGAIAAVLVEARQIFSGRWDFTQKEFNRLWDLTTIIFLAVAAFLRFSEEVVNSAYKFFQWFPLIFLPMLAGQVYSNTRLIPFTTFSWYMRGKKQAHGPDDKGVNFGWVYFALCLITAGASNLRDHWFYLGTICLAGIGIWSVRPKRFAMWTFASSFALAAMLGFFGHVILQQAQQLLEGRASDFFSKWSRKEFDALESRTAMGRIGELKQSPRVVLKVKQESGPVPSLLRQASYGRYREGAWQANSYKKEFAELKLADDTTTWTLSPHTNVSNLIRINSRMSKEALVSLPLTAAEIQELPAATVRTNSFGATLAVEGPSMVSYLVKYGEDTLRDAEADDGDLRVQDTEYATLSNIADSFDVYDKPVEEKLAAVDNFFRSQFRYSTFQKVKEAGWTRQTPLEHFLLNSKEGHCEFFASGTVLLLRMLGVPARYATGYSVQEAEDEDRTSFVVREKHAHAWALAWVNGRWTDVDNTPSGWSEAEKKDQTLWDSIKETWSGLSFGFMEWRWLGEKGIITTVAPWLLGALSIYMAWRIFGRKLARNTTGAARFLWPGADSDYYLIEKHLAKQGLVRDSSETPQKWVSRLTDSGMDPKLLQLIVKLHYRYRFDPQGITTELRQELRVCAEACLKATRKV